MKLFGRSRKALSEREVASMLHPHGALVLAPVKDPALDALDALDCEHGYRAAGGRYWCPTCEAEGRRDDD